MLFDLLKRFQSFISMDDLIFKSDFCLIICLIAVAKANLSTFVLSHLETIYSSIAIRCLSLMLSYCISANNQSAHFILPDSHLHP